MHAIKSLIYAYNICKHLHTHKHTHTYIYIYIYMYVFNYDNFVKQHYWLYCIPIDTIEHNLNWFSLLRNIRSRHLTHKLD